MEVSTSKSKQQCAASRSAMHTLRPVRPVRACALAAVTIALQFALSSAVFAQEPANPATELAASPETASPLKPSPEFAQFPRYVGTLGKRQIVMRLASKTDDPGGIHGEYQFTDTGEVILIAGDREGSTLEAEESSDGTHITGNWVGTFADDGSLSGDRMEVDDSNPVAFDLKPLAAGQPVPAASAAPASAAAGGPSSAATPAAKDGQPVSGVSNLTTGE